MVHLDSAGSSARVVCRPGQRRSLSGPSAHQGGVRRLGQLSGKGLLTGQPGAQAYAGEQPGRRYDEPAAISAGQVDLLLLAPASC